MEKFLSEIELPTGYGYIGNLLTALLCLEIPGCGRATIREHEELRYIQAPQTCGRPHGRQKGVLRIITAYAHE